MDTLYMKPAQGVPAGWVGGGMCMDTFVHRLAYRAEIGSHLLEMSSFTGKKQCSEKNNLERVTTTETDVECQISIQELNLVIGTITRISCSSHALMPTITRPCMHVPYTAPCTVSHWLCII